MASMIEELMDVLREQDRIYQELLPIASEKTRIIVSNDVDALHNITEREQVLVDRVTALEGKREQVMRNIGTVVGKKIETLNLTSLIQILDRQPVQQKELSELRDRLRNAIHRLMEVNGQNALLIEQSLEMIEFNMNFIQSTRMSPGNNTYNKGASTYDATAFRTGMFDAKQ